MVDVVWLSPNGNNIECIFEVENTTGFSSAILRGSNIEKQIPKFMIIPENREIELQSFRDPIFTNSFRDNNWHYLTYTDVTRLSSFHKPSLNEVLRVVKSL